MIEKIKQNPIKVLGIAAGIFFLAAILFMLLPGISYAGNIVDEESGITGSIAIRASLFAFAFAGKSYIISGGSSAEFVDMRANGMIICPIFLFVVALILATILIFGLFKGKFSKKKKIILTIIIGILIVAASGIILASKSSMIQYVCTDKKMSESQGTTLVKFFETYGKFSIGAGAILSPIMMLLGAGSIITAVVLSIKKAK